jgi:hypothetical protein
MRPDMKHRRPVPNRDHLREFRRDMMGDKNNREGQEPLQKRWREIDNFRDRFGSPENDQENQAERFKIKGPPLEGQPNKSFPKNNKPDPGYNQAPNEIRRPLNNSGNSNNPPKFPRQRFPAKSPPDNNNKPPTGTVK